MLFSLDLITLMYVLPVVLAALTVHEYAHAFVADKAGDPTPRSLGRLTLNPVKHLNLWGTLSMLLLGFGWANPVPINSYNFRKPRRDLVLVSIAGPISNLILSVIGGFLWALILRLSIGVRVGTFLAKFLHSLATFAYYFHLLNLSFCLFNLLPVPPLDGSRLLTVLLPVKARMWFQNHERQIYLVFLIWLLCGSTIYRFFMGFPSIANNVVLSTILKVFSLTGWLSDAVAWISRAVLKLFLLIFS